MPNISTKHFCRTFRFLPPVIYETNQGRRECAQHVKLRNEPRFPEGGPERVRATTNDERLDHFTVTPTMFVVIPSTVNVNTTCPRPFNDAGTTTLI